MSRSRVGDVVGGFVAGLYSVPEGIGYAQLAGVNPMLGIYSGMVPVAVAAATTGSVLMMSTLTSAIALTMGGVLTSEGVPTEAVPQAVFTMSLLAGSVMVVLGVLRLGRIVAFVSNAVMTGFVMGVAVLITVGKFDDIFGYKPEGISNKVVEAADILVHPGSWDPATTVVGLGTIALAFALKAVSPLRRYALVITVAGGTLIVWVLGIPTQVIADVASIPSGLSALPIPTSSSDLPDLSLVPELLVGSFSIALVALAQGAGIRPAFPNPEGPAARSSRDFLGQGLGNVAGSVFMSTPTGGSLSRTAVSADGGSRSRLAGFVGAATVVLLVVVLSPVVGQIPEAVIGGLLFVIGVELVTGRLSDARLAWRTGWTPRLLFLLTLVGTLTMPLQWAIIGGAVLSLLVFAASSGSRGAVHRIVRDDEGLAVVDDIPRQVPGGEVLLLAYTGPNFFAETPMLLEQLPDPPGPGAPPGVVVLGVGLFQDLSSTAVKGLVGYADTMREAGCALVLSGVGEAALRTLRLTGALERLGEDRVLPLDPHLTANLLQGAARGREVLVTLQAAAGASP